MATSDSPSIFISGGAQGIGRAVAEKFLAAGWTVGVYDINEDALAKLKAERPEVIAVSYTHLTLPTTPYV